MTSLLKSYSQSPLNTGLDPIFTAAVPTIISSAIATTTNTDARPSTSIGIQRSGSTTADWVTANITVAIGSSVNLLPGKIVLNPGDKLVAVSANQTAGQQVSVAGSVWPRPPTLLLSNASGSIIVAACSTNGIWVSLDGQASAQQALATAVGTTIGAFFLGAFHVYTSGTSKETSTDGLTWTTVACTNGPATSFNSVGSCIVNGSTLVGLPQAGNILVSSADGTTFTNLGVQIPAGGISSLCWTGTNYIVGGSSGSYRTSATAAAWTQINTLPGMLAALGAFACIGAVVVASHAGAVWRSSDHGVTFVSTGFSCGAGSIVTSGSAFLIRNTVELFSPLGQIGTWESTVGAGFGITGVTGAMAIAGTRLIAPNYKSADLALTRRGGLTITASVLEIS